MKTNDMGEACYLASLLSKCWPGREVSVYLYYAGALLIRAGVRFGTVEEVRWCGYPGIRHITYYRGVADCQTGEEG